MLQETTNFLRERFPGKPKVSIVLGSGLGAFAEELTGPISIPYADIPGWPPSTAVGHAGKLVYGTISGVSVVVLAGRAHLYEGYSPERVTYSMRVMKLLGVESVVLSNAAGGINESYSQGSLVLIADHINLMGQNPLVGANDDVFGPRFPDMTEAYSRQYREIAREVAAGLGISLQEGVYAALLGPSYETPAEIRFLRTIGADMVGMSTVPEVIVANHMGMKCLAISCVTNMAAGLLPHKIDHAEVLETGARVRHTLVKLLKALIPRLSG